ncbi:hypothetical protein QTP70_012501 [Hemibagrus guttatus]|uniref:Retrotransposon gag domain-containing protein n=1 Tax=Hemibagrus guttatus TaxID=175788 RepID=A0AAE0VEF3_9TELE|nr:hypothetical protein QTP70_012501 [Hemibagrus guttatus]
MQQLTDWYTANNLSLNINKTKEMVVDFRRAHSGHSPLYINGSSVEVIKSTKFLGFHLAENFTWSLNTSSISKKAQEHLYFLWRMRKAHLHGEHPKQLHHCLLIRSIIGSWGTCAYLSLFLTQSKSTKHGENMQIRCQLYFEMLPHKFSGDRVKIAFIISLLSGKACRWAESMWTTGSPAMQSRDHFLVHFKDVFGTSTSALSVHDELCSLRQANRAIHDYTLHFRTLAASSSWNELPSTRTYADGPVPLISRPTPKLYTKGYACTVEKMTTFSKPAQPVLHAQRFFFVAKKVGGLRPCIDYRVLNSQMVKFVYPLPLVPVALEELRGAHIFCKLDLRNAYNLICIRRGGEWKAAFITPSGHYEYLNPFPRPNARRTRTHPDLLVCPITWSLDDICAATEEEPAPPGGPDGKAYVPTSLRLSLLDLVHAPPGSGHPGSESSLLKERYWWPNMAEDVTRFVRGCSVCAMVPTSHRLPEAMGVTVQ